MHVINRLAKFSSNVPAHAHARDFGAMNGQPRLSSRLAARSATMRPTPPADDADRLLHTTPTNLLVPFAAF
jgi:hypothetical protein